MDADGSIEAARGPPLDGTMRAGGRSVRMLNETDFRGTWQLNRRITDRAAGAEMSLSGVAEFTPAGAGRLAYAEEGELVMPGGHVLRAERRYTWVFGPGGVAVLFDDGRPFHDFVPEGAGTGTPHPCGEDLYRVAYDFAAWPVWRATWEVSGPRKSYRSESRYAPKPAR